MPMNLFFDIGGLGSPSLVHLLTTTPTQTQFLKDRIKVEGKVNNLGSAVAVEGAKNQIVVNANIDFSKRYFYH